jgi:KDO2-lipid IV(A) lauroyltransferase
MKKTIPIPLAPRFWPSWLVIFLLFLLTKLPYRCLMSIGRGFGLLSFKLFKSRRKIAAANLTACFPKLSESEQSALLKKTFAANGQGLMEGFYSYWASEKQFAQIPVTLRGFELLQCENRDHGILLLFPHLTTLEIAGRIAAEKFMLNAFYQSPSNQVFDYVVHKQRQQYFNKVINRRHLREIIHSLRNKEVIVYLPDQDFGRDNSVFAPFYNIATSTTTATARLAQMTNAKVIIGSCLRRPNDQGYDISLVPFPTQFPTGDDLADATFINQQIERVINQDPSNYLWLHRRFKTRPDGEKSIYS